MKRIQLNLKDNGYDIVVGQNILSQLPSYLKRLKIGQDAVIITNPVIKRHYGDALTAALQKKGFSVKTFVVKDGEESKSAHTAFTLIEKLARYDVLKKVFVVALGGGVIGDLAGYVAAAYKRGIPYIQVPTTLLAQVDSSIGGKVAIDLPVGKNLVGAYHQPKVVWSDVAVLETLPLKQIRNGLAEVIKYGVIYNDKFFDYLDKNYEKFLNKDLSALQKIVNESSRIKAEVVMEDEKETKGIRTILNFGHTIGHAIEAAGQFSCYQHGEAISLGMHTAVELSEQLNMLESHQSQKIHGLLNKVRLPQRIQHVKMADILRIMKHDKKFISGKNRFVLATSIGSVKVVEDIPLPLIKACIKKYFL